MMTKITYSPRNVMPFVSLWLAAAQLPRLMPSNIGSLHIATQAVDNVFVSELTRALDVYGVDVVSSSRRRTTQS